MTITNYREGIKYLDEFYTLGELNKRIYFFQSGEKHMEDNYLNRLYEGKSIIWRKNGSNSSEAELQDSKNSEMNYVRNFKEGPFTAWCENGDLKATGNYKNDCVDGDWKFFDKL